MQIVMEVIAKLKLPIKRVELFDVDKCKPYFKPYEIILSRNNIDIYRIFWTRVPTEDEIKKLKKII